MAAAHVQSIPDYVRCGAGLYYVTWPRLLALIGLAYLAVLIAVETAEHLPTESDLVAAADAQAPLGGRAARRAVARKVSGGGATRGAKSVRAAKPAVMRAFCAPHSSLNFLGAWQLAALGAPGWPTEEDEAALCDWAPRSKTEMSYSLCTFNRTEDTQISATVHREGTWNAGKAGLLEKLLPRVNEMMDMPERNVVIDVGANIGFYTLLAATRGYDTVAVEPSREAVSRLLFSLRANGVRGARSGEDEGINTGHTRRPVGFVFANAASDVNSAAAFRFIPDNPGASYIEREGASVGGAEVATGECAEGQSGGGAGRRAGVRGRPGWPLTHPAPPTHPPAPRRSVPGRLAWPPPPRPHVGRPPPGRGEGARPRPDARAPGQDLRGVGGRARAARHAAAAVVGTRAVRHE